MKDFFKLLLQKTLGFDNYLFVFSKFKINTLRFDKNEGDFLHFVKLISKPCTVLDIGANIGIMAITFYKQLPQSHIIAFEPMPANLKALNRIIKSYRANQIVVEPIALGNSNGTLEMVMPMRNNVKFQGLSHVVHESIPHDDGIIVKVPVQTLDTLPILQQLKLPVGAIKLDVENFEFFVLDGGKQLIKKYKPIIYAELWDNENRKQCFVLMQSLGYEIQVLINHALVTFNADVHQKQNFFFIPISTV
ncbi:MAG: FkbM family methyltransferase [Bacteroidia bacterium]|nr:FkbM family methyltransferase [Bacteroidia bacterium]HQV00403.1 FkbM family methyltransferase [Bacteroidia bacterium]